MVIVLQLQYSCSGFVTTGLEFLVEVRVYFISNQMVAELESVVGGFCMSGSGQED